MKAATSAAVLVLATTVLMASPSGQVPPPAPQQPATVFRTGADVVTVDASVQRERRPVTGLKAADFELLDNGVAQEVTGVTYEKLPIDVTLVLDVSASVTGAVLDELRRALRQVRTDLTAADRLRLLAFNMRVRRLVDFTQPSADVDPALAALRPGGSSAVFDALAVALATADAPGRRRLVVLFSDGQDSSSISDADALLDVARRSTPTVATILGIAAAGAARVGAPYQCVARLGNRRGIVRSSRGRDGGHGHVGQGRREPDVEIPAHGRRTSDRATSCSSRRAASSAPALTPSRCA